MVPLFNRELSWLEFNRRVLAEAASPSVPLLERVKFLSITATNLDEFLMVRLGAIRSLIASDLRESAPDGLSPRQQLVSIREQVKAQQQDMYSIYATVLDDLGRAGITIETAAALSKKERAALQRLFHERIGPMLTPLAFDPGHPFPFLASGSLNLALTLEAGKESFSAFVKVPRLIPRFVAISEGAHRFLPIEELIRLHAAELFPGLTIRSLVPFRVLRNADILIREEDVEDLLVSMETELRRRERKEVVWLEADANITPEMLDLLQRESHVSGDDTFMTSSLPKLGDLIELYAAMAAPELKDEPFNPRLPVELAAADDVFATLRARDVLLHRPYDSYAAFVEILQTAADDPDVIAIKQTLYRTEPGSAVVDALERAASLGKQVTTIIEVQARFDEKRNIAWARRLEEAGVQVVYGLVGIKIHAKICLIVRREGTELRRYTHLSTGNYNARTARLYTDLDLITADEEIGRDAAQLMNVMTGYSALTAQEFFASRGLARRYEWKKLIVAPGDYQSWVLAMIDREIANAGSRSGGRIVAKMNSLVDPQVIEALYRAADAGVKIQLIVRGVCCLVPRDNIRVVSIIDRFLEHSRIMLFGNGGASEIFLTSGDWMPRNFIRRIEVTFPVLEPALRKRIERQILETSLADDTKSWRLHPDGSYTRRKPGDGPPARSQQRFIDIARAEGGGPVDGATTRNRRRRKRKKS